MPKDRCIFCDGGLSPPEEHVWPYWLRHLLRGQKVRMVTRVGITQPGPRFSSYEERVHDDIDRTIATVCGRCNRRWMARLENDTAPFMKLLVQGWSMALNGHQQRLLARWALKTTGTLNELFTAERRTVWQPDLKRLRQVGYPPKGVFVWLAMFMERGHYPGGEIELWNDQDHLRLPLPKGGILRPKGVQAYKSTIQVNHLIFHVVRVGELDHVAFTEEAERLFVKQIWPPKHKPCRWPPPRSVDHQGRDALARARMKYDHAAEHSTPRPRPPAHG